MHVTPRTCPGPGDLWQMSWQEEKRQAEYERLVEDFFEKKELQQRPEYFAGKSQVDEAELNKRIEEFTDLMTPGEAVRYLLSLGVPTELSEEDKKLCEDIKQFRANEKNFSAEEFRVRCQKRAAEKAERERKAMEALMDIRNEPLFAGL